MWPPFWNTRDKTLKSILVQVTYFRSGPYMRRQSGVDKSKLSLYFQ